MHQTRSLKNSHLNRSGKNKFDINTNDEQSEQFLLTLIFSGNNS